MGSSLGFSLENRTVVPQGLQVFLGTQLDSGWSDPTSAADNLIPPRDEAYDQLQGCTLDTVPLQEVHRDCWLKGHNTVTTVLALSA